eukprot:6542769-Prorocentrum_lima.AAC.1
MTSSLVGSEMCIRDSNTHLPPASAAPWGQISGLWFLSSSKAPRPVCCLLYTSDAADDMRV